MDGAMSPADIYAMTRNNDNNDGWGGGAGAWWMIILFAMIWGWGRGGFGGAGNGGGDPVTEAGLCNAMNFNNLENAVGRLSDAQQSQFTQLTNGVCNLGYELQGLNNATNVAIMQGNNALATQIAECCCTTQRGIDAVNYNNAMNTAAINANTTAQVQRVLDQMCQDKIDTLQSRVNQLETAGMINGLQNDIDRQFCGVVRYPNATTYTAGYSPYWNQGCGCNGYQNI